MGSLGDKLRAIKPIAKSPPRPAATGCMTREELLPLSQLSIDNISRDTLKMMLGTDPGHGILARDILFLDTETTGLSRGVGTLAFLVGVGFLTENGFALEQYLMRDYDEEPFVLAHVLRNLSARSVLVTYNGTTFDMPLLINRLVMNRIQAPEQMPFHIDLLHVARRVYKLRLQRCSLSTLESEVFGIQRVDDLPGAQVPERYFRYLATRDEALLTDILDHNRQDILSMGRLLNELSDLHLRPLSARHHAEIYSLGRVFERRGESGRARQCYRAVNNSQFADLAAVRIAETYRKEKDPQRAAAVYEGLIAAGKGGAHAYIALAKLYEFRLKQPARALEVARGGMLYCLETLSEDGRALADLKYRHARLLKKNGGI